MANKQKEIDTYTHGNNAICPYCGNESEYESEYLTWNEGEKGEITCYECEKDFVQYVSYIEYSRESITMEEHLEHQIEYKQETIIHFKELGYTDDELSCRIKELTSLKRRLEDLRNDK